MSEIEANGRTYRLTVHALDNMVKRYIPEDWVVEALENAVPIPQGFKNRDRYDYDIESDGEFYPIRVIVKDESQSWI
ncbi:MAG: hypothetical protein H7175_01725 [Burkholderiales bacterium]|nr:hypothetical protein [Anaerolineae bacterium]